MIDDYLQLRPERADELAALVREGGPRIFHRASDTEICIGRLGEFADRTTRGGRHL
jgi:hypothetical protein